MKAAEAYDCRARRMFGGMAIYTGPKMFAFLYESEIGLKLAPPDLAEALSLPGAEPLRPDPEAEPMREYVRMPADILDNFECFQNWVMRSANYVRNRMH
ncbi:MAG: TfoX/Sxy family protein [Fimbriimonadaceae bacterium]|nr:TfoX/Sxy family protein [Fimbriimonadaceae bacterium]